MLNRRLHVDAHHINRYIRYYINRLSVDDMRLRVDGDLTLTILPAEMVNVKSPSTRRRISSTLRRFI